LTGAPVGLVLALMDEMSERSGGTGFQDRIDEKIYRHFTEESPLLPFLAASWQYQNRNDPIWQTLTSPRRGGGGPSVAAPTSTDSSKRSESVRTSSAKGYSAHGFSSGKAPTARGKCPKGHYWSYKKKKCVKSKFK